MKKFSFFVLMMSAFAACSKPETEIDEAADAPQTVILEVDDDGISVMSRADVESVLEEADSLTTDISAILLDIREDKRLACELFSSFAEAYPIEWPMARVATAELTHMACLDFVLAYYDAAVVETQPGVFEDTERQNFYNELHAQNTGLVNAYFAMALLEEKAIVKYSGLLDNTENVNVNFFAKNLLNASTNHFKMALRQITRLEGTYTPSYLTEDEFAAILESPLHGNGHHGNKGEGVKPGNGNKDKGNRDNKGKKGGRR